jgi:hypothetical protein
MRREKTTVRGRTPLARDSQQWMLDYLIQETGKVCHHMPAIGGGESGTNNWAAPLHAAMCDWLRDRFADQPLRHPGQAIYVEAGAPGPTVERSPSNGTGMSRNEIR